MIDASVARSAGLEESAPHVVSRQCRDVLDGILRICHKAVFSKESLSEWRSHSSRFARRWLRRMSARKKVIRAEADQDANLRTKLFQFAPSEAIRDAIEKDAHLIEVALRYDKIVLSRDEKMRKILGAAVSEVRELQQVMWANPDIEEENLLPWLEQGARMEAARKLGTPRR